MGDDDHLRRTIPFEDIELIGVDREPVDDLLEDLGGGDEVEETTDPFRAALQPTASETKQHEVPVELMSQAMRPEQGWVQTYGVVGRDGVIRIDAEAAGGLPPGTKVELRIRIVRPSKSDKA